MISFDQPQKVVIREQHYKYWNTDTGMIKEPSEESHSQRYR